MPQAARLLAQPVQPFQAGALHPARRALHRAGMEIEGGARAQHHRRNGFTVIEHPGLLLRTAEADEHETRAGVRDRAHHARVLLGIGRPERRREAARDAQRGERAAQARGELLQRGLGRPVEKHRQALLGGARAALPHQIRAADALLLRESVPAQAPGDRGAVGHAQVGVIDHPCEVPAQARADHGVHIAGADAPRLAALGPGEHAFGVGLGARRVDAGAEHRRAAVPTRASHG